MAWCSHLLLLFFIIATIDAAVASAPNWVEVVGRNKAMNKYGRIAVDQHNQQSSGQANTNGILIFCKTISAWEQNFTSYQSYSLGVAVRLQQAEKLITYLVAVNVYHNNEVEKVVLQLFEVADLNIPKNLQCEP
ncbi:hypothetical protein AXF42_Ash004429 [Apostasia shenzhenica]|uniref:Cysteine proteinase inhibitor n=1 Tax=Apostasia shenzhenica TaxID=1088818 RepID=A0A2I0A2X2_9ASPA|nr:hypothetical protein AXF42_Ash004429 [Apostasia shenzhenica]